MTQPFEAHLTAYLQHATSADKATRDQAEAGIRQLEEADWGTYVGCLSTEIANEAVPEISRQMAGVLFKNALDSKDSVVKVRLRVPSIASPIAPLPYTSGVFAYRSRRLPNGRPSMSPGRLRSAQLCSRRSPVLCAPRSCNHALQRIVYCVNHRSAVFIRGYRGDVLT